MIDFCLCNDYILDTMSNTFITPHDNDVIIINAGEGCRSK
jgi:hypothetical protein